LSAAKAYVEANTFTTLEETRSGIPAAVQVMHPPSVYQPQETTLPSLFSAANALVVEKTFTTPLLMLLVTAEESPPRPAEPAVTTLPSDFTPAKAYHVEYTSTTLLPNAVRWAVVGTPPYPASPHITTLPSALTAAKARYVDWMRSTLTSGA
jgi:hypothetical protein